MRKIKLLFMTSARSEYGLAKSLLSLIQASPYFELKVLPFGLHLLEEFGNSISEIVKDGFEIEGPVHTTLMGVPKPDEFTNTIARIVDFFKERDLPDAVFMIGDRLEMYACALACHFMGIPLLHSGGGALTLGAVDNIYRYNITNLSYLHFATSVGNYNRLKSLPNINQDNIYFVGSVAIDNIIDFKQNPVSITQRLPELIPGNYVLMTFHTATNAVEDIPFIMKDAINYFLDRGLQVLLTAPNNDTGFEQIMEIISASLEKEGVFYIKSLGARNYYAAINECRLVCGNSSSGLIEVPYFKKPCVNIGSRQEGRESDPSVYHVAADINKIREVFDTILDCTPVLKCHDIFGKGGSSDMILEIMLKKLANLS